MATNFRTDRALAMDLEMTCDVGITGTNIIQIGISEMDLNDLTICKEARYYVRPKTPFVISNYCSGLTGITAEQIQKLGRPLAEVFNTIRKHFAPTNKLTYTWGRDVEVLVQDSIDQNALNPWPENQIVNASPIFRNAFRCKNAPSLPTAMSMVGLKFAGEQHDGLIDARNLARLQMELFRRMRSTYPTK